MSPSQEVISGVSSCTSTHISVRWGLMVCATHAFLILYKKEAKHRIKDYDEPHTCRNTATQGDQKRGTLVYLQVGGLHGGESPRLTISHEGQWALTISKGKLPFCCSFMQTATIYYEFNYPHCQPAQQSQVMMSCRGPRHGCE